MKVSEMLPSFLQTLTVDPGGSEVLRLRRAWPRESGELLLEYVDLHGTVIGGRWDPADASLERESPERSNASHGSPLHVLPLSRGRVFLHYHGFDRVLQPLEPLCRAGGEMLSHRVGRRAVVRCCDERGESYWKLVPPKKAGRLIEAAGRMADLEARTFQTARLLEHDEMKGTTVWAPLVGERFDALFLAPARLVEAASRVGRALRSLHESRLDAAPHTGADEVAVLERWLNLVERFSGNDPSPLRAQMESLAPRLDRQPIEMVPIHRDFYDKQIIVSENGAVGFLDFDTLALGDPALDLANMVVHLQLRARQGRCAPEVVDAAASSFLSGYGPEAELMQRVRDYADATRLRLACVYAFRPLPAERVTT